MDSELLMARMFGMLGGTGSGVDWAVLVAFFAVAVVYVVAPVIGYRADRRGMISAALFCLIGYAAVALFQMAVQYLILLDRSGRGSGGDPWIMHVHFLFALLKMLVFVLAMLLFAVGVQSLRLRNPDDDRDGPGRFGGGPYRRPGREDDA